ncbi:hypothetical protein BSKO_06314 [Bryopsis sp. KO-2023]|nr:hypothetical protein BSKO_06314 [Bryopsis sp. KO-2023]
MFLIAYGFLISGWLRVLGCPAKPGLQRFLVCFPVVLGNCMIPLLFDAASVKESTSFARQALKIVTAYVFMWMTNCKVLAFCLNRGMLAAAEKWSFWRFCGAVVCTISIKTDSFNARTGKSNLDLQSKMKKIFRWSYQACCKAGLLLIIIYLLSTKEFGFLLKETLHNWALYTWLGCALEGMQIVALAIFDINSIDSFNYPFVASSSQDNWGNRWNLTTASTMKPISYDLVMADTIIGKNTEDSSKSKKSRRPEWRRVLAVLSIFTLSGILHTVYFWYLSKLWIWQWMVYFFMLGMAIVLEQAMEQFLLKTLKIDVVRAVPSLIRHVIATVCFLTMNQFFYETVYEIGMFKLVILFQQEYLS